MLQYFNYKENINFIRRRINTGLTHDSVALRDSSFTVYIIRLKLKKCPSYYKIYDNKIKYFNTNAVVL